MPGKPKIVITRSHGERDLRLLMEDVWQSGPVNEKQPVKIERLMAGAGEGFGLGIGEEWIFVIDARTGWELLVALATYMAEIHRYNSGAPLSYTFSVSPYDPECSRLPNVDIDERLRR